MHLFFKIAVVLLPFALHSQVREQKVEEIHVQGQKTEIQRQEMNSEIITRKSIQELQPEDIGTLLQKFPGVSLRSYGGLGGLKTFSFRSLGSQHTATCVDGFVLQNTQIGQVNLGQLQSSSIESIRLGMVQSNLLSPVSALFGGNELALSTFEGSPYFNTTKIRFSSKYGSFAQLDEYLSLHFSREKFGLTLHGKYRRAQGNYPYRLTISNYTYEGIQKNNQLKEIYGGASLFFRPNKMKQPIRLIYRNNFIDQGLPGATVLYNDYNKQYLNTIQHQIHLDWQDRWNLVKVRYYSTYQNDNQIYTDSFYLNQKNLLQNTYQQHTLSGGVSWSKNKFGDLLNFYGGIEQRYAQLRIKNNDTVVPVRWQTFANAGFTINEKKFKMDLRLSYQAVVDDSQKNQAHSFRNLFAPFLNFERKESGKLNWKSGLLLSSSSRLPSFNELYYSQVGNQKLKPEEVQQVVLSTGISKSNKKWTLNTKILFYYNLIHDKILAIPTKNLFVWSIQNIGEVHASGMDLVQNVNFRVNDHWKTSLQVNYSLQYSVDRSDANSPTYGNQIAYVPMHTANADITIYRKKTSLHFSGLLVGERYSLNQNITSNLLAAFFTVDLGIFQGFTVQKKHEFFVQFHIKNMTNESYVFVRSYAMPGRNYLLTLGYEF